MARGGGRNSDGCHRYLSRRVFQSCAIGSLLPVLDLEIPARGAGVYEEMTMMENRVFDSLRRPVCALVAVLATSVVLTGSAWAEDEKTQPPMPAPEPVPVEKPDPKQTPTDGLKEVKTESGLKYWDIKVGEGPMPEPTSKVSVHYSGWFIDGKLFASSVKSGEPMTLRLNQFIKGWGEGVSTMKVGGKRRLEIPYELAYGEKGKPPTIPPKAPLIFEVELLSIVPPPKQTSIEGIQPVTTPSGLKYWDIKVGDGAIPQPTSQVTVHYSGWLTDGTLFDSSVQNGQPLTLGLNRFVTGWSEGVGTMKVGGKRRLEVPYELAYGEAGRPPTIPPKAALIFEVELLAIK